MMPRISKINHAKNGKTYITVRPEGAEYIIVELDTHADEVKLNGQNLIVKLKGVK